MKQDLAQQAVSLALSGKWEEAVGVNRQILKSNKSNVNALNRLARAHAELGELKKAKLHCRRVLAIDPFNTIARKSYEKWKGLKKGETVRSTVASGNAFIEESGKTKIVTLLHPGATKTIAKLDSGDEVKLDPHGHRVSVTTSEGSYIGRLADDLGAKLKKLIKMGNKYQVLVKSTGKKNVTVFIRETKRSPKLAHIPSFSGEKIDYISFTSPGLVYKKDDPVVPAEEEEE